MSQKPDETRQIQFLLTNLVFLGIFILALVLLAAAYPTLLAPDPTVTPTVTLTRRPSDTPTLTPTITLTPTLTRTLLPTFTPTITPTPTQTPTPVPTATPAGPPTLTPASPRIGGLYELRQGSPDLAARAVELLENLPNTLPATAIAADETAYWQAFRYAVLVQREALLRFPSAPQAETWRWGLAYNLARMGDPRAAGWYADLVAKALNRSETTGPGLAAWLAAKDPRLELYTIDLPPLAGYLSSTLVEVRGRGSAFLWVLETTGAFQVQPVADAFDFLNGAEAESIVSDLTHDGVADLVIYPSLPPEAQRQASTGDFRLAEPRIFDLSQVPPRPLSLQPGDADFNVGMEFKNTWAVVRNPAGQNDLAFQIRVFPACPVDIRRTYRWNGEVFALVEDGFAAQPNPATLSFCRYAVDHAVQVWGPGPAAGLMETVLPAWPPEADEKGEPYPADARDEWRYRMGVLHALAGDLAAAGDALQDLTSRPTIPGSRWVEPAQSFLTALQGPEDLYQACIEAPLCDPSYALRARIQAVSKEDSVDLLEILTDSGVVLRASGYFDFDADGEAERWLTVRHRPTERLELWAVAAVPDGLQPIRLGAVESNRPDIAYFDETRTPPVVWIDGRDPFQFQRRPTDRRAYLTPVELPKTYPDRFKEALQRLEEALLSGSDPTRVQADLLDLEETPGLLCEPTWSCDPYYYLLGLAGELAGDDHAALENYLFLWWNYSKSPFTTVARLKIEGEGVQPSATLPVTATPTGTPGPSATPAAGGTPTVTGTPPTATLTPTGTLTPGVSETPTPTLTPTQGTYP